MFVRKKRIAHAVKKMASFEGRVRRERHRQSIVLHDQHFVGVIDGEVA